MALTRAFILLLVATLLVAGAVPPASTMAASEAPFRTSVYEWADVCPDGLSWTSHGPLRVPGPKPRDRYDVPMYRVDEQLHYRPGALAINGMKRIDAYRDTGDEAQLEQALKQARRLRKMALEKRNAFWLPFWYDYLPAGQWAPWFNAMTQGLVLSFYVRLHHATGDEVHLEAADGVFRSFLRHDRKREPWVAYVDEQGFLWLEHYPLADPDHVLNAHLHAVFGIYEYWQATRSAEARHLLNGAVTTMRRNVDRYRRPGQSSIYGLRTRTQNPKYHEIHVWQLNLLARLSGDPYFAEVAGQLRDDLRPKGQVNGRPAARDAEVVGPHCRPSVPGAEAELAEEAETGAVPSPNSTLPPQDEGAPAG